jgi:hypothetical protein
LVVACGGAVDRFAWVEVDNETVAT